MNKKVQVENANTKSDNLLGTSLLLRADIRAVSTLALSAVVSTGWETSIAPERIKDGFYQKRFK